MSIIKQVVLRRSRGEATFFDGSEESFGAIRELCRKYFECQKHEPLFVEFGYGSYTPNSTIGVSIESYPTSPFDQTHIGFNIRSGMWYVFDRFGVREYHSSKTTKITPAFEDIYVVCGDDEKNERL